MLASPRSPRSRLRPGFGDDGVSEVLGNVILIVMTVSLLGGFGALVLTTVSTETPTPPASSFTIRPTLGEDAVAVRLVSGSAIELASSTLRLLVNGADRTLGAPSVAGDAPATTWSAGQDLVLTLTQPLAADDRLLFVAADNASGKSIGTAYATVSGTVAGTVLLANDLTPALSFSPGTLTSDGVTTSTATVNVGASMGLLLVDRVTLDLSPVHGPAQVVLRDDGLGSDDVASDGMFSASFAVGAYDYPMLPGSATVSIAATAHDVLGRSATATAQLTLVEPTPTKADAGATFRDIGSSAEIGTTGYIHLERFALRDDLSQLANDQVALRVSDLGDATKVWTALVSFGHDTAGCAGKGVVTQVELKRSGVAGSVVYAPQSGDCFEVTPDAQLDLADIGASTSSSPVTWVSTGDAASHVYSAAGVGTHNEAVFSFFGDTLTLLPSARGLEQADFAWGPGSLGDTVPAAITTLAATPGDTTVALSWSAPADGGSAILEYNVYQNGALVATVPAPASTHQVTGLVNGASYTFRVRAVNAIGEAPTSNAATATPSTTPGAPTLSASPADGAADLSWSTPASGGSTITGYHVYAGASSGATTWAAFVAAPTTTHTVTGLTNGVAHFFNVTAENVHGQGASSGEASATPSATATAPTAPQSLTATAGTMQVGLAWAAPSSDGGSAVTGYQVWRGTTTGALSLLAGVGTNTTFLDANVAAGTTYHYHVRAVNAVGTSPASAEASATPTAASGTPSAPQGLVASPANQQVGLNWSAPGSDGGSPITGYKLYRGTTSGSLSLLATIGTNRTFTDQGLTNGVTYYYSVRAVNGAGDGTMSAEVSAKPDSAVSVDCGSAAVGSGSISSCTAMQFADLVYATFAEGGGGSAKTFHATFRLNVTGVVGTQTLELKGYQSKGPENLLIQALDVGSGTYQTIATLDASSSSTNPLVFGGPVNAATHWPDGVLTIRMIDAGPDPNNSEWSIDYARLVTT